MARTLGKRLGKLEDSLNVSQKRKRIAKVVYDSKVYPCGANLPTIDANVILCLPDNGRRFRNEVMPPEGYRIIYSYV